MATFRIPPLARLVFSYFLFPPFAVCLYDFSLVPVVFVGFRSLHFSSLLFSLVSRLGSLVFRLSPLVSRLSSRLSSLVSRLLSSPLGVVVFVGGSRLVSFLVSSRLSSRLAFPRKS